MPLVSISECIVVFKYNIYMIRWINRIIKFPLPIHTKTSQEIVLVDQTIL